MRYWVCTKARSVNVTTPITHSVVVALTKVSTTPALSFETLNHQRINMIREKLAELEHDQWVAWSKDIAATEQITPARLERWQKLWCPYSELTEAQKDQDREWGDKAQSIVFKDLDKKLAAKEKLWENHKLAEMAHPERKWTDCETCVENHNLAKGIGIARSLLKESPQSKGVDK